MIERPIIFSTAMVQAILAGRKTMTRRVVKPNNLDGAPLKGFDAYELHDGKYRGRFGFASEDNEWASPYGRPGDLLWVRETFCHNGMYTWFKTDMDDLRDLFYPDGSNFKPKWKPSIHMPKKYARIWLKVTGVRVERLQDISTEDAIAEGYTNPNFNRLPLDWFIELWDSINAKQGFGWDQNPWVWVVEFDLVDRLQAAKEDL